MFTEKALLKWSVFSHECRWSIILQGTIDAFFLHIEAIQICSTHDCTSSTFRMSGKVQLTLFGKHEEMSVHHVTRDHRIKILYDSSTLILSRKTSSFDLVCTCHTD